MVRLRLDRRVRSQITSSTVLEEVYAEVCRRIACRHDRTRPPREA